VLGGTATAPAAPALGATRPGALALLGGAAPSGPLALRPPVKVTAQRVIAPLAVTVPSTVSAATTAPLTVAVNAPAGAGVVQIRVFRLTGATAGAAAARSGARRKLVASVYRSTTKAKRYTFRLTEKRLRHLKPGRYLVEVRTGKSRAALGPATARTVTVTKPNATR
jgi:hypothetical protein